MASQVKFITNDPTVVQGLPNEVQFGEETRRELPVGVVYRRGLRKAEDLEIWELENVRITIYYPLLSWKHCFSLFLGFL